MNRKLASIQRILAVEPIEGADNIELVRVLGWQCVAKKGEFRPGDFCVYFEIDSVLPPRPEFAFMEPRKYQVRTIKLRGTLGQGLALPLDDVGLGWNRKESAVGCDVTEMLGIEHRDLYDQNSLRGAEDGGGFPGSVHRTDEQRIQSAPELLDELRGHAWVATRKMHGTSCTVVWDQGEFQICNRGRRLKRDTDHIYTRAIVNHNLPAKLQALGRNLAIQGEVMGPKVQDNCLKLEKHHFLVFTVQDLDAGSRFFSHDETFALCRDLNLTMVEVVAEGASFDLTQDQLLELARGTYPGTTYPMEGIVVRPREERKTASGERLSFKVINNEFLLKGKG